jgi:hypothetical protein
MKLVWNVQWTTPEQAMQLQHVMTLTPEQRKAEALVKNADKIAAKKAAAQSK